MDVETVMQSEVSQKEKNKNCLLTICGIIMLTIQCIEECRYA